MEGRWMEGVGGGGRVGAWSEYGEGVSKGEAVM